MSRTTGLEKLELRAGEEVKQERSERPNKKWKSQGNVIMSEEGDARAPLGGAAQWHRGVLIKDTGRC